MELLELFAQVNWIISILIALLFSIIANLVTPSIRNWYAKFSKKRSSARVEVLKSELEEVSKYANSTSELSLLVSTSILQVLVIFSMASAVATFAAIMPFMAKNVLDSDRLMMELMSPLYYFLSSLSYVLGVFMASNTLKITSRIRNFDKYKSNIEKSIIDLEENSPQESPFGAN